MDSNTVFDEDLEDEDLDICTHKYCAPTFPALCCGRHGNTTNKLRGSPENLCLIITKAMTSDDCRDAFENIGVIQSLLETSNILSSDELKMLLYFDNGRMNLLEEYISTLINSREHLKALVHKSDSIFETAGDILHHMTTFNWQNSFPTRASKGPSGSTIIYAANEIVHCLNEVKSLRYHVQSVDIQVQLLEHIRKDFQTFKMCYSGCEFQNKYRNYITQLEKEHNASKHKIGMEIISDTKLSLELNAIIIDDSPLNSIEFSNCLSPSGMDSSSPNGKRSRTARDEGMLYIHLPLFRISEFIHPRMHHL